MIIPLMLGKDSYDIVLERGAIKKAAELFENAEGVLPNFARTF